METAPVKLVPEAPDAELSELERLGRENAELRAEIEQLKALADRDVLTPTLNRRAFLAELKREMAYCRRYDTPSSVLFLDLDGFKGVNDQFGHIVGDQALQRVAEILVSNLRESDAVGRLGGDEFAVLLRQADAETAIAKAEALSRLIEAERFEQKGPEVALKGSFGVRAFSDQASAEAWLAEADAAMFVRKKTSRPSR
jgi:diguanylate cyclase (GGDEF)-like protein